MAGFWSSFSRLGLGDLDDEDLYATKKEVKKGEQKTEPPKEEDFLLLKKVKCPVCEAESNQMIMKTGKVKLLSMDVDLRPRYEYVDSIKYDVYVCDKCGYAALSKNFSEISLKQVQMVKEGICSKVVLNKYEDPIYSYKQAAERYQLALASSVVKKGKNSEKAYLCLKSAWIMRGFAEEAKAEGKDDMVRELQAAEQDYLAKAYAGFSKAVSDESFPIYGMPESTMDYLLAAIAYELGKMDEAGKMVSRILTSPNANNRAKDKARALKDMILEGSKKNKN